MRLPLLAGMVAVVFAASLSMPAQADDEAPPAGYPTWEDVRSAQRSEAGKAAEVSRINELLGGLQTHAEALGNAAVASAAEYAATESALQSATSKLESLSDQAARAGTDLAQYKKEIGALAAQSYRTGGTNMGFFVALDAVQANSIQGLNIVKIVSDKTAALVARAAAAERVSRALADQEKSARAERERLAGEAKTKLDAAKSAQRAMSLQITVQQEHSGELTAQLASLKGTTAAVEGEFRQGQAALAAYEASQAAKRAAAAELQRQQAEAAAALKPVNPAPIAPAVPPAAAAAPEPAPESPPAAAPAPAPVPTPTQPAAVVAPSMPGGAVNDPAAAKSYASGRLSAYG